MFPPAPHLSPEETEWVAAGALPASHAIPKWEDVCWTYEEGQLVNMPWHAPVWHSGDSGEKFVPGLPRQQIDFWDQVILRDHSQ